MKINVFQALLFCLLTSHITSANAAAIASADASVILTITEINNISTPGDLADLEISGLAGTDFSSEEASAGSNASISSVTNPLIDTVFNIGDGLEINSGAVSNSFFSGSSLALIFNSGIIDLINNSLTDTFEIAFSLDFNLSVSAIVDDIFNEDAIAAATFTLSDDLLDIDLEEIIFADSVISPPIDSLSDTLSFLLRLAPETSNQLFLEVAAATSTESVSVPEPSTYILCLLGLIFFSWQKKRGIGSNTYAVAI
jgi:hypothetical protein